MFCKALGGRINWHKSSAIWAYEKPRDWMWGEDKGLHWLTFDNNSKYLGFSINYKMAQKERDSKVLQQVRGKLTIWNSRKLSLA
jgi:hypothetical protein